MLQFNHARFCTINELTDGDETLRAHFVAKMKAAELAGLGAFVDGRKGNPSRYVPAGECDPYAKGPQANASLTLTVAQIISLTGTDHGVVIKSLKSDGRFVVGRKGAESRYVWGGSESADDSAE
jgi:hypothetical protein